MGDELLIEDLVHSSNILLDKPFNVRKDTMKLPNGKLINRHVIEHPGAVAIIPIISDMIILVRQFRQATGKILLELPAGTLKKGEEPAECAARELEEETGYKAGNLRRLFQCYLAPGYSTEIIQFYLATNLKKTRSKPEADEFIEVKPTTKKKILQMIASNEIEDAKTICGILTLEHFYLEQE
ncbi:MAG: ADP-ribose pyrophosphatase [Thermoproteota archaeon]|nr:ADP-ribose pyrophosphatase [Thermoproteota archaeon]